MDRYRQMTIGEILTGLKVYRPFLAIVLVFALILWGFPADNDSTDLTAGASSDVTLDTSGPGATTPNAIGGTSNTVAGGLAGPLSTTETIAGRGAGPSTPGSPSVTAAAGGTQTAPGGNATPAPASVSYPGLGTEAALSAPDCDRETGYLRLPSKLFNFPCVPPWNPAWDNAGATDIGVTSDEITILIYEEVWDAVTTAATSVVSDPPADQRDTQDHIWPMLTNYAELYGRRIKLVFEKGSGSSVENHRADAVALYDKYHPFAAMTLGGTCFPGGFLYQLAQRGVFTFCTGTELRTNLEAATPYYWITPAETVMLHEQHMLFTSEFICKRLVRLPARWAGDPVMQSQTRKFGLLYIDAPEFADGVALMEQTVTDCGGEVVKAGISSDQGTAQTQIPTAISRLRAQGANAVVLDGSFLVSGPASKQATNQNYRPEWIASGYGYTDATVFVRAAWDLSQAASLYGFRGYALQPPREKKDGDAFYYWYWNDYAKADLLAINGIMPGIHSILSGIHLAGPNLTKQTFLNGLLSIPPTGGSYFGGVSSPGKAFGSLGMWPWEGNGILDTSIIRDATFTYWSNAATGQDETGNQGAGMMMFIDGGKRYRLGEIPTGEPNLFGDEGIAQLDDLGPADKPREYSKPTDCSTRFECWGTS